MVATQGSANRSGVLTTTTPLPPSTTPTGATARRRCQSLADFTFNTESGRRLHDPASSPDNDVVFTSLCFRKQKNNDWHSNTFLMYLHNTFYTAEQTNTPMPSHWDSTLPFGSSQDLSNRTNPLSAPRPPNAPHNSAAPAVPSSRPHSTHSQHLYTALILKL